MHPMDKPPEEVEQSPNGRYIRYNILLGKGACKRVYKALDTEEGREVAWNQVELMGMDHDEEARQHLHEEIRVLQQLKHKNIMTFYAWWVDQGQQHINFITELFTAGNLRQYRKKLKIMSENVLKRWAHQILEGLLYLHGHVPPIVHRDLKCDNIFVNSATGEIKIGDLGLATVQQQGMSVVGTPEFMAPEVYDESYDERCDIYSFGMCLLELATQEYPYSECHSVPQIFKKVTLGVPPASLARVQNPELRDFIALCIAHDPADRPSARELLKHPYLESVRLGGGAGGAGSNGGGDGSSNHGMASCGGSVSSLLAAGGSCGGSGAGTGWNTPSGTLHCAASVRDLREALHQQESLARHQHQQHLLHPHTSCPLVPPAAAASDAIARVSSGGGGTSQAAAHHEGVASALARGFSGPVPGTAVLPPPPVVVSQACLRRSVSGAGAMPAQPSPLGRSVTARSSAGEQPPLPPSQTNAPPLQQLLQSRYSGGGGPPVIAIPSSSQSLSQSPSTCSSPRLTPRSRLGLTCDGSVSGGGGGAAGLGSPPSPLSLSPAPTLSLQPEGAPAGRQPVGPAGQSPEGYPASQGLPGAPVAPPVAPVESAGATFPELTGMEQPQSEPSAACPQPQSGVPSMRPSPFQQQRPQQVREQEQQLQQQRLVPEQQWAPPSDAAPPPPGGELRAAASASAAAPAGNPVSLLTALAAAAALNADGGGGGAVVSAIPRRHSHSHSHGNSGSRRSSGCSLQRCTGAGGSGSVGTGPGSDDDSTDSDEDEEILVPIELLKAGLLEEGFVESAASSHSSSGRRSLSFSQSSYPYLPQPLHSAVRAPGAAAAPAGSGMSPAHQQQQQQVLQQQQHVPQPSLLPPSVPGGPVASIGHAAKDLQERRQAAGNGDGGEEGTVQARSAAVATEVDLKIEDESFERIDGEWLRKDGQESSQVPAAAAAPPQQQQPAEEGLYGDTSATLTLPHVSPPGSAFLQLPPSQPLLAEAMVLARASGSEGVDSASSSSGKLAVGVDRTTPCISRGGTACGGSGSHSRGGSFDAVSFNLPLGLGDSGASTPALRGSFCGSHQQHLQQQQQAASGVMHPRPPATADAETEAAIAAAASHRKQLTTAGVLAALPPSPLPSAVHPQPACVGTASSPPGSPALGTTSAGAAAGSVRLPSFRNKVLLTVTSPPGARSGSTAAAAAPSSPLGPSAPPPPLRCLRTTSARAVSGMRVSGGAANSLRGLASPSLPNSGAHAHANGFQPFRMPPSSAAAAASAGGALESGAARAGLLPLPSLSMGPGIGADDDVSALPFRRSASQPLTGFHAESAHMAGRLPTPDGEERPHGNGDVSTAATGAAAAMPNAATREAPPAYSGGFLGAAQVPSVPPHSTVTPAADGMHGSNDASVATYGAAVAPPPQQELLRLGQSDGAAPVVVDLGTTRSDAFSVAAAQAAAALAGPLHVPHAALLPLKEDSAELVQLSPRSTAAGADLGGGVSGSGGASGGASVSGGGGVDSTHRNRSGSGGGADALGVAGVDDAEMTVVREFARPIQGVIMRLKQWKRLVGDRAKALRK